MADSAALGEFKNSIKMAEELINKEKEFGNPPKKADEPLVRGLRGGAAVLMVASFEAYLRRAVEEHLSELTKQPPPVEFAKLPDKLKINGIFSCLEAALRGPKYQDTQKIDRLPGIRSVCGRVAADILDPTALSSTQGNPDSKTVKGMFSNIGVLDVFTSIHNRFRVKWGRPIPQTFINDKLEEIVKRRHSVAHSGNALDIGRSDLNEAVKFLKILAELLDSVLHKHVEQIMAQP
jgi:hypothetical protein